MRYGDGRQAEAALDLCVQPGSMCTAWTLIRVTKTRPPSTTKSSGTGSNSELGEIKGQSTRALSLTQINKNIFKEFLLKISSL